MRDYFRDLMKQFKELERRERAAVLSLSIFLFGVVLYAGIWAPLNSYALEGRVDHDRYLSLLTYLKSTESQARSASDNQGAGMTGGQSLLSAVSKSARSVGINPSRLQPEGSEAVSVWFDAVPFTKLMLWLERLESGQGIVVQQITIDRRDVPGQVSARLVLRP
ncbi:MAG: type II secretion system protein M [Gammaproteobacteria bacterium]|jgi:general secretion pathway protein M|nr:type II secretion system protein M [Gammaproteobacteria bacterium]